MIKFAWVILVMAFFSSVLTAAENEGPTLANWQFVGKGVATQADKGILLSEYPGSSGVMLFSPEPYGCDTRLQFEVLPFNPESVLVVMMAASNMGPDISLRFPSTYDGGIAPLLNDTEAYFFAFHNAAHNRTPFVRRHPFDRENSTDLGTHPNNVVTTKWHKIEVVYSCDGKLLLAVDGTPIIETIDSAPLQAGSIVLRLRGTNTHAATALFRDVSISAAAVNQD
jgi:hypothetical protein